MRFPSLKLLTVALLSSVVGASSLSALPFNEDMVNVQPKAGGSSRAQPAGSIPVGGTTHGPRTKEEALALKNPVDPTPLSVERGKRLYAINCTPCHGAPLKDPAAWGSSRPIVAMPGPNLADPMYHAASGGNGQGRTDAQIYAQIHFGGAIMQRVGWKLSATDTWNIINYIRETQRGK